MVHLKASADGGDSAFNHPELRAFFEFAGDTGEVTIDNVTLKAGHTGTEALGSYTAPNLINDGTFDGTDTWTGSNNGYNPANGQNAVNTPTANTAEPWSVNMQQVVDMDSWCRLLRANF